MQAMVLDAPADVADEPLTLRDLPRPEPGPHDVLLRVSVCGVCRTDLHTVEADFPLPRTPLVPGHQVVGVVEAVGGKVTERAAGDRVGVAWLHSTCGRCRFCTSGRENLCTDARFTGLHADGGYAEFMTVPAAFAYEVPAGVADEQAAPLLCAGIIGYRALVRSGIRPGGRLGLYGFGASAHVAIQVARHWGCEVSVFTRAEGHKDLARRLGAAWVGEAHQTPPHPLEASVIFAPAGHLVPPALEAVDHGGTVVLAGIHVTDIPSMTYEDHVFHEKVLTSVTAATREDGRAMMRLAAEAGVETEVETFPLAEASRVLRMVKASEVRGAAVLRVG
jgi:propanol-preferring alcohol dehydrogenase